MVTDDKVKTVDVDDNVNTRDQNRTLIVFAVIAALFIAGLCGLGMSHAPEKASEDKPVETSGAEPNTPVGGQDEGDSFSVRKPIGAVELPGTVGKPQHWTVNGKGNTPAVPVTQGQSGGVSNNTGVDQQSLGKAESGATASDAMKQSPEAKKEATTH